MQGLKWSDCMPLLPDVKARQHIEFLQYCLPPFIIFEHPQ